MERSGKRQMMMVVVCALVLGLCATGKSGVIYVDDDATGVGDGLSWTDAFTHLQDALAAAQAGDEVRVAQGIYKPDRGAGIAPCEQDATFSMVSGTILRGGYAGVQAAEPNEWDVAYQEGGALHIRLTLTCERCLFAGNEVRGESAVVRCDKAMLLANTTFVSNRAPNGSLFQVVSRGQADAVLVNSIVWDSTPMIEADRAWAMRVWAVSYSNVQGGWPGAGNIDVDPCFASPGHWEYEGTHRDWRDDVWVDGDYHLKSQAGRWDPSSESWVQDEVTSPCIDAGDPNAPIGEEPFPNGGIVNLGAYGGAAEASKSYFGEPVCALYLAGDINGDCKVDFDDLLFVLRQWSQGMPPTIRE